MIFRLLKHNSNFWVRYKTGLKAYNSDGTPQQDSTDQQVYIDMRHTIFSLRLRGSAIEFYQSLNDATKNDYSELRKQFLFQYRSSHAKRMQGESEKVREFLLSSNFWLIRLIHKTRRQSETILSFNLLLMALSMFMYDSNWEKTSLLILTRP